MLNDIGDLLDSEIIRDTTEDVHHVLSSYFRCLRRSRQIFVVSSMTSIELIDAVIERLAQGVPVEVVINKDVFEKLDKEPYIEKYYEMKALDWGKRFFQYFKDRSIIVEIPKR